MLNKYTITNLVVLLKVCLYVKANIFNYDLLLLPSQEYVQYNEGYLRGPGSIDLRWLTFTAVSEAFVNDYQEDADDDDGDFGGRFLKKETNDDKKVVIDEPDESVSDDEVDTNDAFYVDIAIFPLPSKCATSNEGCDWATLGVGKRSSDGDLRWCCSEESAKLGLCQGSDEHLGRLMIDEEKFQGERLFVSVPKEGPMKKHIDNGSGKLWKLKSGTYVVLYANCNEDGREIAVKGQSTWKSKHGYLPGELFGFMYFYYFITLVYALCFGWFAFLMHQNKETRIEIENWIILAIALGLSEMCFRSYDYLVWNATGIRSPFIIWIGIIIGVLKQGISRCLAVMVSMGWGVSQGSLSSMARTVSVGLAVAYIIIAAVSDGLIVFAAEHVNKLSYTEEEDIIDVVFVMEILSRLVNIIFMTWVLYALNGTIKCLESNSEKKKLERMQQLLSIFTGAALLATALMFFSIFDRYKGGIIAEEHAWAKDAAYEVNYLFVLLGIAILWRPNESAQHYAYFQELKPVYDDDDEEIDNVELSDM